jgi:hypothetical protein
MSRGELKTSDLDEHVHIHNCLHTKEKPGNLKPNLKPLANICYKKMRAKAEVKIARALKAHSQQTHTHMCTHTCTHPYALTHVHTHRALQQKLGDSLDEGI